MLGAIIGDVVGSIYEVKEVEAIKKNKDKKRSYEERIKILDKNTPLLTNECSYTDDTTLTTAIIDAILNKKSYNSALREYGLREINLGVDIYGRSRFSNGFVSWLKDETVGKSTGNGAAMRISGVGYLFNDLNEIKENARLATIPSHDTPEAILAAEVVATVVFMARKKCSKKEIKEYIEKYYNLDFDLEDLQKNYRFKANCNDSVPIALYVFLISNDFEDGLRKAISVGGDSDTIACIVGAISEAYYGIPEYLIKEIESYIPDYIKEIINEFYLTLEFNNFLESHEDYTKEFKNFIKDRVRVIDRPISEDWYSCFPMVKNNILVDLRLLVPKLISNETLLVKIHEYAHAMELYKEIGSPYIENTIIREENAKKLELKYIERTKNENTNK